MKVHVATVVDGGDSHYGPYVFLKRPTDEMFEAFMVEEVWGRDTRYPEDRKRWLKGLIVDWSECEVRSW